MTEPDLFGEIRGLLQGRPVNEVRLPAAEPIWEELPPDLHPALRAKLEGSRLYSHQAESYRQLRSGRDVVISTGTSSGKTLAYLLPLLQSLIEEPAARAILLYPTKALAQDQLTRIQQLTPDGFGRAAIYDADTPKSQRAVIRREASLLVTNPDMLHVGILPNHELWRPLFRSLRFVVIDEAHSLKGVFGSQVAWVLRRLLRLAEWQGSRPQVAAGSATLRDPIRHLENLTGRTPVLIGQDGSQHSERRLFLVESPTVLDASTEDPHRLSARLLAELAQSGRQTLAFCQSRLGTELTLREARQRLDRPEILESYRGGYTAKERRQIESGLAKGKLKGLAATNALEMGLDIGALDAVILNGFPGSVASFWQQAGRAGRGARPGAAIFIAHDDALQQRLAREPEELLRHLEPAILKPDNPWIAGRQLVCAAHERPLAVTEASEWTPKALEICESLTESGELALSGGRFYSPRHQSPASEVNLRGSLGDSLKLVADGEIIGDLEEWRAMRMAYPSAVYLHRDQTFLIESVDWPNKLAVLRRAEPDFFTEPVVSSWAEETLRFENHGRWSLSALQVSWQTIASRRRRIRGGEMLGEDDVEMPVRNLDTVGIVFDLPPTLAEIEDPETPGAIHALQHVLLSSAPWIAGCSPYDIGSVWHVVEPSTLSPRILVYDETPGGLGLSEELFHRRHEWMESARSLAESCPCLDGCPKCIQIARCEARNEVLSKPGLLKLLKKLADGE